MVRREPASSFDMIVHSLIEQGTPLEPSIDCIWHNPTEMTTARQHRRCFAAIKCIKVKGANYG